jgi:predicted N-acetyltransferase YhbS
LIRIAPLSMLPAAQIEALLDAAFGPDRKTRTAYRIRAGMPELEGLSFAAQGESGELIGSLQSWPIALHREDGPPEPLVLVGPVAVRPNLQRGGVGKALMHALLAAADAGGADAMAMIGDPEYYERFFGFSAAQTQGWELPGPFERHRLLARINCPGGLSASGMLGPDPAFAQPGFASEPATA